MARTKSIKRIDDQIHEQEEKLCKLKERCDKISENLDRLYAEKKALEAKGLLEAIARSSKIRAEVLAFRWLLTDSSKSSRFLRLLMTLSG